MSSKKEVKITCPRCDATSPFTVWLSINTADDPELKESVRNQSLFRFTCPYCGVETMIDYGLLYHQPEEKLMVHYAVTPENEQEVVSMLTDPLKNEPFRSLFDAHYVIRVVRSRNQMLEKLAIFDANFDDRLIELYKRDLEQAYKAEHPDASAPQLLLFNTTENEQMFQIIDGNETKVVVPLNTSYYYLLLQRHGKEMRELYEESPVVDQNWADVFLRTDNYIVPRNTSNTVDQIN